MSDSFSSMLQHKLMQARQSSQWRTLQDTTHEGVYAIQDGVRYLSFCSNDYLGIAATIRSQGGLATGAGASRLVSGNHPLYRQVETRLAQLKHTDSALLFGSGYFANIGTIPALMGKPDLIIMDKASHACMIDGVRLSGAAWKRFAHNDVAHLEQLLSAYRHTFRHCLVLTETVFSMHGTLAPLEDIYALCERYDAWLMTDDAHGFGVLTQDNPAHIQLGTLSKAIGCYGGYVCGSNDLIDTLVNYASPLIFSTGLPEMLLQAIIDALHLMTAEPQRADRVMQHARRLSAALRLPEPESPIIPLIIGDNETTLAAQSALKQQGLLVSAIRPPTVAPGTARLRISLSAAHTDDHITQLIKALQDMTESLSCLCKPFNS